MWDRARQKVLDAAHGHGRLDFDEITFHVSQDHSIGCETAISLGVINIFFVYELIYTEFIIHQLIRLASEISVLKSYSKLNILEYIVPHNRSCQKSDEKPNLTRFDARWHTAPVCHISVKRWVPAADKKCVAQT